MATELSVCPAASEVAATLTNSVAASIPLRLARDEVSL
jgi:hypothetical protein